MRLRSLRHLVSELTSMESSRRIVVIGSASLLAAFPDLGEQGFPLEATHDVDFLLDPVDGRRHSD